MCCYFLIAVSIDDYFQKRQYTGVHLLQMINDILGISKMNAGELEMQNAPFSLITLNETLQSLLMKMARKKGLSLVFETQGSFVSVSLGDKLRLKQVLINLITIAIKFTVKGQVKVTMTFLKNDKTLDYLEFSIEDSGVCISEDNMTKIFQPFINVYNTDIRTINGSCLGLTLIQYFTQRLGAEPMKVSSVVANGSRFHFCLPFSSSRNVFVEKSSTTETTQFLQTPLILVVDDNEVNRLIARAVLERLGMKVLTVNNGQEAVDLIKVTRVDLVLMDVQMPIMNGYEATRQIREFNQELPIIAITASDSLEDINSALASGMNGHLTKPFDTEGLKETINKWINAM